eukprot:gnl/Dysnectes_brevis/3440_a4348_482.p1 GENE.gnl/Dysnectes_brevis/3440_a4348_482~~gnl/Dysnectes_brevis/3440_a4348_482.p1  ORF type:complete len:507 (+),score=189.62 gnl/Dysnectes_brevis/3440_a4348_482:49-1569(+)
MNVADSETSLDSFYNSMVLAYRNNHFSSLETRIKTLKSLRAKFLENSDELLEALHSDLHRSSKQSILVEFSVIVNEIDELIHELPSLMKPTKIRRTAALATTKVRLLPMPVGPVLVIAPFNFPLQLALLPVISALAAGNPVMLRMSTACPATAHAVARLLSVLPQTQACCAHLPRENTLLSRPWGRVMFTGSPNTARYIMRECAATLTPVTLELGGSNPFVICPSAPLTHAAERLVFAKFINAGQMCIAPNYCIVVGDRERYDSIVREVCDTVKEVYTDRPETSPHFCRMARASACPDTRTTVSRALEQGANLVLGSLDGIDEGSRYIPPLVLTDVTAQHDIIQNEVFAPVLPLLHVESFEQAMEVVLSDSPFGSCFQAKPLASMVFTQNKAEARQFCEQVPSGATCVNTAVMQAAARDCPFGGIGESGMGGYHGKRSFEEFTHRKPVLSSFSRLTASVERSLLLPPYPGVSLKRLRMASIRLPHPLQLGAGAVVVAGLVWWGLRK